MNRYIFGGLLASLVVLLSSGIDNIGRLFSDTGVLDRSQGRADEVVGTNPIEQAGRVVQRQNPAAVAAPNATFEGRSVGQGTIAPQNVPTTTISPEPTNVIPRTGGVPQATTPTTTGDIAPIRPDLVQPGNAGGTGAEQDLDSIPALW